MSPYSLSHLLHKAGWFGSALLVASALTTTGTIAQTSPVPPSTLQQRFESALMDYERSHWRQAYTQLSELGELGHPQAARIALDMWRFGSHLYGFRFEATAAQVARWQRLEGCAGDSTGRECALALQAP